MTASNTSLNDRLECVMECVMHNGFDNFDVLVTAYYNGTFAESSPLSYEQRLSRTRRLPKVIADICHAAGEWDPWERRGFHEEILKTTETILLSEGDGARNNLNDCIIPLAQEQHTTSKTGSPNAIKQIIQKEVRRRSAPTIVPIVSHGNRLKLIVTNPMGSDDGFGRREQGSLATGSIRHSACSHCVVAFRWSYTKGTAAPPSRHIPIR